MPTPSDYQTIDQFTPYIGVGDVSNTAQLYFLLSNLQGVPATQAMTLETLQALQPLVTTGWINVKDDYNAIGDGVTDDTVAIQDAINAGGSQSRPVYFPASVYAISARLNLPPNCTLFGDPGFSELFALGSAPGDEFTIMRRSGAPLSLYMYGMRLRHNGQISGTPNFASSNGVDANQTQYMVIDKCEFYNFPNACITAGTENVSDGVVSITNCKAGIDRVAHPSLTGALFADTDGCMSFNVSNNETQHIARSISIEPNTVAVDFVRNVTIHGNTIRDGDTATISLTNSCVPIQLNLDTGSAVENASIIGNKIYNCGNTAVGASPGHSIYIKGETGGGTAIRNVTCLGNVVQQWSGGTDSDLVLIRTAENVTFSHNVFDAVTWTSGDQAALVIDDCANLTIAGNTWNLTAVSPSVIQVTTATGANKDVRIRDNIATAGLPFQIADADGVVIEHSDTGTPEGNLAAAIGSLYRRTDGISGSTLYTKTSGIGTTGWQQLGKVYESQSTKPADNSTAGLYLVTQGTDRGVYASNGIGQPTLVIAFDQDGVWPT